MLTTSRVARRCEHVDRLFSQFLPLIFDNLANVEFVISEVLTHFQDLPAPLINSKTFPVLEKYFSNFKIFPEMS